MPGKQLSQKEEPVLLVVCPAGHFVQEIAPVASEYKPGEQSSQSSAELCRLGKFPLSERYFPMAHFSQEVD